MNELITFLDDLKNIDELNEKDFLKIESIKKILKRNIVDTKLPKNYYTDKEFDEDECI